jgi:hypothetical protein
MSAQVTTYASIPSCWLRHNSIQGNRGFNVQGLAWHPAHHHRQGIEGELLLLDGERRQPIAYPATVRF